MPRFNYPIGAVQGAAIYACLLLLFGPYLAAGSASLRAWLAARLRGAGGAAFCVILFMLPLTYCAGTGDFRLAALKSAVYSLTGNASFPFHAEPAITPNVSHFYKQPISISSLKS
jgi:hypothetical protein